MGQLDALRNSWNNKQELEQALIGVAERQLELAELIAQEESNFNSAFAADREESIKGTDSLSRARTKALLGSNKTKYEYEFQALNNLVTVIISRMAQFHP